MDDFKSNGRSSSLCPGETKLTNVNVASMASILREKHQKNNHTFKF